MYNLANNTWDQEEIDAIMDVIDSNRFTMGSKVEKFEKDFAEYHRVDHAVMVNSGSSANLLSIAALTLCEGYDLQPGDTVIVPAVSWSTTYFPLQQYGLKLLFVDINIDTLNVDLEQLEEAAPKAKAFFMVNLLGNSNNITKVRQICAKHNLLLIEDNCESLGATYYSWPSGTFGLISSSSFFFSHHMQTMEGGMILTNDEELAQMCKSLRAHGWLRELPDSNRVCDKLGDPFYDAFRFALPGYSVRPLEMSGAIGSVQLQKLDANIEKRRANAKVYKDLFGKADWCKIQKEIGESSWFGFSIVLTGELENRRDEVIKLLSKCGIETRPIVAGNFTKNPVIKYMNYEIHSKLDNADYIHDNGFFLGNNSDNLTKQLTTTYNIIETLIA